MVELKQPLAKSNETRVTLELVLLFNRITYSVIIEILRCIMFHVNCGTKLEADPTFVLSAELRSGTVENKAQYLSCF